MKYFLDTNIIIYFMKGQYPTISERIKKVPSMSISIPTVVIAEIEYGARKSIDYKKTIQKYRQFTDVFPKIPFGEKAAEIYGKIRATLEKEGNIIGANDLIIASIVIAENGTLVTNNVKEFERIPELFIENWTE